MRLATVVGTRPQFVKAALVSEALRSRPDVDETLIHTGQHYDDALAGIMFSDLELGAPDVELGIGSGPHGAQTGRMLEVVESALLRLQPHQVLVYGDTNSALAGALAAAKLALPVAHVEAGVRSGRRFQPEEINRIVVDHVAELLLAPSAAAAANLDREGRGGGVAVVGDVMLDAVRRFGPVSEARSTILTDLGLSAGGYVLATVHRAENTDDPQVLAGIVAGLQHVATEIGVVWPVHPRTTGLLAEEHPPGLLLVPAVGYLDMLALERGAAVVATDSGGVQREAFYQQVPSVTLRHETEWTEIVDLGWTVLVPPTGPSAVAAGILDALGRRPGAAGTPYGDGTAAREIVAHLTGSTA